MTVPSLQLPWGADEEKKRQCVFKGKDPQVSPAGCAAWGRQCPVRCTCRRGG